METEFINLKILLPFKVFAEINNVKRIVLETSDGSYGLLQHRLDCVAALVPGIFTYETEAGGVHYLAVDEGVLVKAGMEVMVSVRNAIGGADLGKLHELVEKKIKDLYEHESNVHKVMAKMESSFMLRLEKLKKE